MSFKKAIKHGKERRKPYRGSKRFDSSCRNHGSCPYCSSGRLFASKRRGMSLREAEQELVEPDVPKSWADRCKSGQPLFLDEMAGFGSCYSYGPEMRAALLDFLTRPR